MHVQCLFTVGGRVVFAEYSVSGNVVVFWEERARVEM